MRRPGWRRGRRRLLHDIRGPVRSAALLRRLAGRVRERPGGLTGLGEGRLREGEGGRLLPGRLGKPRGDSVPRQVP